MKKVLLNITVILVMLLSVPGVSAQNTSRILIINNYNIAEEHMRKNKKAFFTELADSLPGRVAAWALNRGYEPVILTGYTPIDSAGNNLVYGLIRMNECSLAIVINKFDVYFNIRDTEVTRDENGKSKTAYYDITSFVTYSLYDSGKLIKTDERFSSTPHSSRSVVSGLLATGPNIMNNKEDAVKILDANVRDYMMAAFPVNKKNQ